MKAMAKENLVNKARNLGVRASQHTAKVINQVHTFIYDQGNHGNHGNQGFKAFKLINVINQLHTFMLSYTYMCIDLKGSLPKCIWDILLKHIHNTLQFNSKAFKDQVC